MRITFFVLVTALSACGQSQPPAATPAHATAARQRLTDGVVLTAPLAGAQIGAEGLGPLRIGMTIAEVNAFLRADLESVATEGSCTEWSVIHAPTAAIALLTYDGRITRVTTYGDLGIRTEEGIGVGSTSADVMAAYPDAESENAEYVPAPGGEIYVWSDRENWTGLHFTINEQDRVSEIQVGGDLRNLEGCATL